MLVETKKFDFQTITLSDEMRMRILTMKFSMGQGGIIYRFFYLIIFKSFFFYN